MRFAVVRNYTNVGTVRDYLPANYKVVHIDENGMGVVIAGEDDAGWTLDDYVIPRFGSGLMVCKEVWPVFTNAGETGPDVTVDIPFDWLRMPIHRSAS